MGRKRVLLFEDEASIAENLRYALESDGFAVTRVATAGEGMALLARDAFDLVILDVGLPDENGFEVCKRLRLTSRIPIFFLTARSDEIDRVVGLEIGADDYITKPFSPREVTARVKALFRRLEGAAGATTTAATAAPPVTSLAATPVAVPAAEGGPSRRGDFELDEPRRRIRYRGRDLELSRYEYGLLRALLLAPGRVFSRAELMEKVWEDPDMSLERTIDAHVKSIRAKLKEAGAARELIETHRGFGYSLSER